MNHRPPDFRTGSPICRRLEISLEERRGMYGKVAFHNHKWTPMRRVVDRAGAMVSVVLLVPKAGEMLYHLKNPPAWAGGGAPAMVIG